MSRLAILAILATSAVACTKAGTGAPTTITPTATITQPSTTDADTPPIDQTEELRKELAAARAENLMRLEAYALSGAFPKNQEQPGLLNVFRDVDGHLCAVANLINLDGHSDLINVTASNDNFIVLANVSSGPLHNWILDSGFTQEEIGMIQVPYMGEFRGEEPIIEKPSIAEFRAEEVERVRTALLAVHRNIAANTVASLDIAVARHSGDSAPGNPSALAQAAPQRFAQPPR